MKMSGKGKNAGYHISVPEKWVDEKTKELYAGEKKYLEKELKWYIGDRGNKIMHELHKV